MHGARREFLRTALTGAGLRAAHALLGPSRARPGPGPAGAEPPPLVLEATGAAPPVRGDHMRMGTARRRDGRELRVDSRGLQLDGQPWLPVMGEFHYARCPPERWREELQKAKAGGLDIVSTYVFWIHHEEVEGTFDWSGRRSLRGFLELARELGLLAVVRCGPWCHGEVRNGGLPDWLLRGGARVRSDDPAYLARVRRFWGEIGRELSGLLWKDGGPVVGIQCENEYGGPAEHLLTLKRLARELGLDVPLYTRTGWPPLTTPMPSGEMIPLFGAYAEGFWDRELTPMPAKYGEAFLFRLARTDASIAFASAVPPAADREGADHPYFCCEIGGGMERSYHRRIRLAPADVEATALVKLGSGNNLQGYYMYHGGTNPEGRLTTLQESQATGYWNDVPVKSYDFQAPLGQFGQVRPHYHQLRRLHLFLRDQGARLATWPAHMPRLVPAGAKDTETLRWTARTDGRRGFVFVSNYQRLQPMAAKAGVHFDLRLVQGSAVLPRRPFTVPADTSFVWPFNLETAGATLRYATAQLVCGLAQDGITHLVFAATPGVPPEFVFARRGARVEHAKGAVALTAGEVRVSDVACGTDPAIRLRAGQGQEVCVLLLDHDQSLACWKERLAGRERLFLSRAGLVAEGDWLRLVSPDPADLAVSILPAPRALMLDGQPLPSAADGLFRRFTARAPGQPAVTVRAESERVAGPPRTIAMGSQGVAEAPADPDFAAAAAWRLRLSGPVHPERDLLLRISYVGDVARLWLDGRLLADDFYNGSPFELGLGRHGPELHGQDLRLEILPLRKDAPIYLPDDAWPDFAGAASAVALTGLEVVERHHVELRAV